MRILAIFVISKIKINKKKLIAIKVSIMFKIENNNLPVILNYDINIFDSSTQHFYFI